MLFLQKNNMEPVSITILPELKAKCPPMALGILQCKVINTLHQPHLWIEIEQVATTIRQQNELGTIKENANITATRNMYLACGKKPGRYRPSAEALMRRIVKGESLYQINTLVDAINLISLKTGYSIGGFDARFIKGALHVGIGREGEPYEGIGRGPLNVHQLPIIRDELGGIGTPTSDEVRTAIRPETTEFLMIINGYTGKAPLPQALTEASDLLKRYVNATNIITTLVE